MSINFLSNQYRNRCTLLYTGFCIIQTGYPFSFSLTTVIRILGAVLLVVLLLVLLLLFVLLIVLAVVVTIL